MWAGACVIKVLSHNVKVLRRYGGNYRRGRIVDELVKNYRWKGIDRSVLGVCGR